MVENGTRVRFRISGRMDVKQWRRRHERGEVPDAYPYGLDRLSAYGVAVEPAPSFAGSRQLARAVRGIGRYEWWETLATSAGPWADVELCWDERVGVPAVWFARRSRTPLVVTGVIWLTDGPATSFLQRGLAGPALRAAHRVWALSSAQLPVLRDDFGVPPRRLTHLSFGVDSNFFHPTDVGPIPGLIVGIGNDRHRDHETLVSAVVRVRRTLPCVQLELATRQHIEVPSELGIRHESMSHQEVRDLYRRSQVVVVALRPNLHVSGVTVVLEAMACGRPVVVTDTPGMRDYVTDGETGLLVPPGSADALAAATAELLRDPARASALGAAGRRAVERRFNTATQARQLAELVS